MPGPDIFLSYNREDAAVANVFADAFVREGLEVWWDQTLRSGETYDEVTEVALRGAKAVVVLWSPRSVASHWVRAEATIAHRAKTLVPATIEACDKPVMFELTQTADLSHWRGEAGDHAWQAFLGDVRRMVGRELPVQSVPVDSVVAKPSASDASSTAKFRRHAPVLAVLLLILAAGALYALSRQSDRPPQSVAEAGKISVAVLPFRNLSADKDQEFFSDGMTEEITSALAKVPGLNVVSRTSAFQFKGENRDMRAIGKALGASHLIGGSVRKEGNALRITAQLVKADDGRELWSESYDRELKGVFALQEDIAKAIAGALQVPLGLKTGQLLVANRTTNTKSYETYLRAKALVRSRGDKEPGGPLTKATELLEQAVADDPNYAPAWGLLAQSRVLTPIFSTALFNGEQSQLRPVVSISLQRGESAALEALRLDPSSVDAMNALGYARRSQGRQVESDELFRQALAIDPGSSDALHWSSGLLGAAGRTKEALAVRRRVQAIDPYVPQFNRSAALQLWLNGHTDEAIGLLAQQTSVDGHIFLSHILASTGRFAEAAAELEKIPVGVFRDGTVKEATRLLRQAATSSRSPAPTGRNALSASAIGWVYVYTGAPERALDFLEGCAQAGIRGGLIHSQSVWTPAYAGIRETERFKALMRRGGYVEYWRATSWPKFCQPTNDNDFVCH